MKVTSVEQEKRLLEYWSELIPQKGAERPWLFFESQGKRTPFTWKDVRAQAHCIAAYLMDKGLKPGEAVGIIASSSPLYLVVDLALQFLGSVNITLPEDIDLKELKKVATEYDFGFFFLDNVDTFMRLEQLKFLKPHLKEVVLQVEDAEGLAPEKLVTFDRVITLGKVPWREQLAELNERKQAINPDEAVYSIPQTQKMVTFSQMMATTSKSAQLLQENGITTLMSLHAPTSLVHRSFAYFAPMKLQLQSWCHPGAGFSFDLFKEVQPEVVVLSPRLLDAVYSQIETFCNESGGALRRGWAQCHKVREKRDKFLKEGQKVPMFTRMAFNNLKRGFFGKIRKLFGGKVKFLIVEKGDLTPSTQAFFTDMGWEIKEA